MQKENKTFVLRKHARIGWISEELVQRKQLLDLLTARQNDHICMSDQAHTNGNIDVRAVENR